MNLEYPGSIPNLNHEKLVATLEPFELRRFLGLPTPQMQHSTMVGHPTVRPLEIAAVSNLLCLLLLMCFFDGVTIE